MIREYVQGQISQKAEIWSKSLFLVLSKTKIVVLNFLQKTGSKSNFGKHDKSSLTIMKSSRSIRRTSFG